MAKNTKIVGIDVGNLTTVAVSETKTVVCDSRVKKVESNLDDFNKNEKFTFEGEKYLADSGSFENDILKYTKENYLSLLWKRNHTNKNFKTKGEHIFVSKF